MGIFFCVALLTCGLPALQRYLVDGIETVNNELSGLTPLIQAPQEVLVKLCGDFTVHISKYADPYTKHHAALLQASAAVHQRLKKRIKDNEISFDVERDPHVGNNDDQERPINLDAFEIREPPQGKSLNFTPG